MNRKNPDLSANKQVERWCLPDTLKINFLLNYNRKQLQILLKKKSKKKLHKLL